MRDLLAALVMFGELPSGNSIHEMWYNSKPRLMRKPRLVNHFMLGADPEFVFSMPDIRHGTIRVDATTLLLRAGAFVGADQNGRLAEIRPKPSRSALSVLSSIMVSLRWLGILRPESLRYGWEAGAFKFNDGIGGHIHFGRKRPTRAQEVVALDAVSQALYMQGVFPADEQKLRMGGDARNQLYGHPGDFRPQIHGYEYRSLPSWLDSPWLAYLCLVLGKLAVFNPDLVTPWADMPRMDVNNIRNLLAYYKAIDDDAAIALKALEVHGLPKHKGGDFKERWGINDAVLYLNRRPEITILPPTVAPSSADRKDLFEFLVRGEKLGCSVPLLNWEPSEVPNDFVLLSDATPIRGQVGMGELLWDVVTHKDLPVSVFTSNSRFYVTPKMAAKLGADWKQQVRKVIPDAVPRVQDDGPNCAGIGIPKSWRTPKRIQQTKQLLVSGIFPLWRARDADKNAVAPWFAKRANTEFSSKLLYLKEKV